MRRLGAFHRRLLGLIRRRRLERDLDDELAFHLAMRAADHRETGLPPDRANVAARRQFGSVTLLKEQARDAWTFPSLESWLQDIKFAVRTLRRSPGFTAVAIATLALGVGASTAIFSVVDAVLLRPLPFPEPQRLTLIRPSSGARVSAAYLHEWRRQSRTFADIAGWHDVRANLTGRGEPLEVFADRTTPNFFALLATPALWGRTFTAAADLSHVEPEVVLSYGLWQRRYGGDQSAIGQPITLDRQTFTIVGVMPERFGIRTNELAQSRAELWMPLRLDPANRRGILNVVARLSPSVALDHVQAELSLMTRRIEEAYPSYAGHWTWQAVPLLEATVQEVRLTLLVLFGAVGILLLIACANVANLMLSRGLTRHTEFALRLSLGATRGRLVRLLLSESLVLAVVGGGLGVLLAKEATHVLVSLIPPGLDLPRAQEIGVDVRVLMFAAFVTILTAILFGLIPSVSSPPSMHAALRHGARGSTRGGRTHLGSMLIISEVALALILLAGAGLLSRSYWALTRVQPGFQPEHVLTMRTTLSATTYDRDDRIRAFSQELLTRIEHLPGVHRVGFANYLPMSRFGRANRFEIERRAEARTEDQKFAWVSVVGGRYFEAMGIPLLRGRVPGEADTKNTSAVFVIDEKLGQHYWPQANPIGTRLIWHLDGTARLSGEVIGVVGNVRWQGLRADPPASAYWWFSQVPGRDLTVVARTVGNPMSVAGLIPAQVREIDPNQPVAQVRALQDFVVDDVAQSRLTMLLLAGFAAAALLLTSIGLYGVIAFGAMQRTQEIGVRVALGAPRGSVLRLVMQRGMLLTGTGLAIGIVAALALGRLVASLLYGITPTDFLTLLTAAGLLASVTLIATYLPARRATRIEPMLALRAE